MQPKQTAVSEFDSSAVCATDYMITCHCDVKTVAANELCDEKEPGPSSTSDEANLSSNKQQGVSIVGNEPE